MKKYILPAIYGGITLIALCIIFVLKQNHTPNDAVLAILPENVTIVETPMQTAVETPEEFILEPIVVDVPLGKNIGLNKPIISDGNNDVYLATNANDGLDTTYWEGQVNNYPNTITIDLEEVSSVRNLNIKLNPALIWTQRTQTFSVLGGDTPDTLHELVPSTTYTFDPKLGNYCTIPFVETIQARYIQLAFTANTGASSAQIAEFEVYGPNLAENKPIEANGSTDIYIATNANDGTPTTYWEGLGDPTDILTVDLEEAHEITTLALALNPASVWSKRTQSFEVNVSDDGTTYLPLLPQQDYEFDPATGNMVTINVEPIQARFVQLIFHSNTGAKGAQVAEISIY